MKGLLLALAAFCLCLQSADKPDIELVDVKMVRDRGSVLVDARVRIVGLRPLQGVSLTFDFIAAGNSVIGSKVIRLEEDWLEPGDESAISAETPCPPKAYRYKVRAFKAGPSELILANAGPFDILD